MKFYQAVGIFVLLNLAFPDCYGYPNHKSKDAMDKGEDKEMKIRAMMETGMAAQNVIEKQSKRKYDGQDAKEESVNKPTFMGKDAMQKETLKDVDDNALIQTRTTWPDGSFGFPAPIAGCPSGFRFGCRGHDNEDWWNGNYISQYLLQGIFGEDITICYCTSAEPFSGGAWPEGRYCINAVGACPRGFTSGSVFWDDEDDANENFQQGPLPEGVYNTNTLMFFCCRSDGEDTVITLPSSGTFVLYQYLSRGCQRVAGRQATEVILKFDDEDIANKDSCDNGPYDPSCDHGNHEFYMCHYA